MSQTNRTVAYREAFDSATIQLDRLIEEMERLKVRQDAVEGAAKALEPVLGSGADYRQESNSHFPAAADVNHTPYPDVHQDQQHPEVPSHSYVHGHGEPQEEMDRRISFALGRTAAD